MDEKEIMQVIADLRRETKARFPNKTEEEVDEFILDDMFFRAFCEDRLPREDLEVLAMAMGYQPNPEILDQVEKEKAALRKPSKRGKK